MPSSETHPFDGVPFAIDPPQGFFEGIAIRRCLRSGLCCKTATCTIGVSLGQPSKGCTLLRGDGPGSYRCGAVEDRPEFAEALSIGEGCCMPLGNTERYRLLPKQAE